MSNQGRFQGSQEGIGGEWRGELNVLSLKNSVALDKACLLWYNINATSVDDLVRCLAKRSNKGSEGVGIQTSRSGKGIRYRISTRRRESVGVLFWI